jgi:hypothetical protein
LIIVPATPVHFLKARQELALAQTAWRAFKKHPGEACPSYGAETMTIAHVWNRHLEMVLRASRPNPAIND